MTTNQTPPAVWIDGDPLMEAIAAAVWEQCRTEDTSLVVDDPRNIAAVAARAVSSVGQAPATDQTAVCICGHTEAQHFEDVCITEITGCDCGDFIPPDAASEVIDRWREAATRKPAERTAVVAAGPVKQRADCTELEWAEQERARFERLYTRETVRADLAEQRADTAARDADIYQQRLERLSDGYAEQRKRAEAMERAMESTAADALAHRGCHRDLMAQCLRAERAEAEAERLRADRAAVLREAADAYEEILENGPDHSKDPRYWTAIRDVTIGLRRMADEAAKAETACTCAAGGDCFAPAGHYADCPEAVEAAVPGRTTDETRRETVEYFLQCQQDDGTWEDASSFMDALDWATERLAAKRARYPEFVWRLAERITTVAVRPVDAPAVGGAQQPTEDRPFIPPTHYRRDDGVECCVHTIPVGPDSCRECRELADT
jgi:hypothetical protein